MNTMSEYGPAESESEIAEQCVVTVVSVERYMTDPVFVQQTGLTNHHAIDAYDLTVADGQHRRKIVLSTTLNRLIQKRMVCVGDSIRLKRVRMRYDETSLNGPGIPVVEEVEVIDDGTDVDLDVLSRLAWHPKDSQHQQYPQPLASARAYYVDLWSSADIVKTADTVVVQVKDSLDGVSHADLYNLKEVVRNWRSIKECKPHLLLRVMRRPRLIHYARHGKSDKWPFQLPLVVGDSTGCCVAVLWNMMAPRYLPHVQEGAVLLLRNYTVKPRFQMPEHKVWHPVGLPWFDIDLNINSHHPQGEVTLLHPSVLESLHDLNLPLLATNFVTRTQLSCLPDDFMCDVAGVITFVGAVQREQMKLKQVSHVDSGGFWIKRWVHILDHSHSRPIIVQLYSGAQRAEFEEMVVGHVLVCRHMRVVHGLSQLQSSRQPLHVYLSSTRDTQIYVQEKGDDSEFPFCHDTTLQSVLDWAATTTCKDTEDERPSEMFFTYPPQPTTLDSFSSMHENLEIVPSDGWKDFVENLSYRQATQLVVQTQLAAVSFHRKTSAPPARALRRRKESPAQVTSVLLDRRDVLAYDTCEHVGFLAETDGSSSATNVDHHSSEWDDCFNDQDYLCLQWRGLNANIILNTVKLLHLSSCPANSTFEALLSGSYDAAPGEAIINIGEEIVHKLFTSVKDKDDRHSGRYLVVLNVYCVDGRTAVMNVNRAFPVR